MRGLMTACLAAALAVSLCPGLALAGQGGADSGSSLAPAVVSVQSSAQDESEPNDDFDHATKIPMNRWVYGQISSGDERDCEYYKVALPQAGSISLTFQNGRHFDNGLNFAITVYDKYYREVGYDFADPFYTKPQTSSFRLPKGACWISVEAFPDKTQPYHFKLTYDIPSTTVKKATGASRSFTAKWTKKSGAAKYQLRYSTYKNMSKAKTLNVSRKRGAKTVTGLKSSKKYWVQVRVAKKIGGQLYYSAWSPKKAVKTK